MCVCPLRFLPPLNDSSNWRYLRLQCNGKPFENGVFSENALFKRYGVICLLRQSPPSFSDNRRVYELLEAARLTIIAIYLPVYLVHKISRFADLRAARAQSERRSNSAKTIYYRTAITVRKIKADRNKLCMKALTCLLSSEL